MIFLSFQISNLYVDTRNYFLEVIRSGSSWRLTPHDLPLWYVVYQQTQRWIKVKVFDALGNDPREALRIAEGRREKPMAAIFDCRTLLSTAESGASSAMRCGTRVNGRSERRVDLPGFLFR
jgi:transposase